MAKKCGIIGVGLMGHGIAKNLVTKGFPLIFKANRNRANLADLLAAGAQEAKSNAEVASNSEVVVICVTGSPQVEEIVYGKGGILEAARAGLYVIDASTSEPTSTEKIRADLAAKGAKLIDAPLARTPKEAEEGRLNTMVGAEKSDFETLKPIFQAYCENIFHVGGPGHGHVLKLINNFLAMTITASTAEALAAAAKSGLSIKSLYEVVSGGGVNSPLFQMMVGKALTGDFAGLKFTITNGQKDMRYYTHMAEARGVKGSIAGTVYQTLVQASELGYGDKFIPSLIEAQEKINKIVIIPR
jgi:3-hydroxyisobutyrate dehydrogenase-like beta-hydroxyacid dehydrogenase